MPKRELAAYRALAGAGLSVVPRLLGRWQDPEIYPFPFAAVTRLPGTAPTAPEDLLDQLGREYDEAGKAATFEALRGMLAGDTDAPCYAVVAARLGTLD